MSIESSLFGGWPGSLENVSCSRATPDLHRCNLEVALEQETFSRLQGLHPKRPLASSPTDLGEFQEFRPCTRVSGSEVLTVKRKAPYFQHFYFSHRPSPLLRGRHLSGSWRGSDLSRFSVGFRSVSDILTETDQNLTKNRPKVDPLQGVRSEYAVYEG